MEWEDICLWQRHEISSGAHDSGITARLTPLLTTVPCPANKAQYVSTAILTQVPLTNGADVVSPVTPVAPFRRGLGRGKPYAVD